MSEHQLPMFDLEEVRSRLEAGIIAFLGHEAKLFEARIGERAMCSHLKNYLKSTFRPWSSDSEYDSFGDKAKRSPIPSRKETKNPDGHLVTPDIIIHNRLEPLGNLLAIEAKKANNKKGIAEDREKLHSYQGRPLCYPYVALLVFGAGKQPLCEYELFQAGENPEIPKPSVTLKAASFNG